MLSAKQLTCIRNNRVLFENLSFELSAGQLTYLTGPNGAGKTTLLRTICGLHQPQLGRVEFEGQLLEPEPDKILYLGHKSAVSEWMSPLQNLSHWLVLTGSQEEPMPLLQKVGLSGLEQVPVKFLSAGQKRRVALVRLWISKAKLWVLDEPFTSIDAKGIEVLNLLFDRHKNNGNALIVTSHQPLPADIVDQNLALEYRF